MSDQLNHSGHRGLSLPEVCLALCLLGLAAAAVLPACTSWIDGARLGAASSRVTMLLRQVRYQAIARAVCRGVVFGPGADGQTVVYRVVEDGNGNGIRRAEVESGIDPVVDGPVDLATEHGGVRFGIIDTEPVPVLPPGSGTLTNPSDPVRFGSSDLASFTPQGTSSSGTVYLLSPRGRMRAVSLYGITGRIRVWDYLPARGIWVRR